MEKTKIRVSMVIDRRLVDSLKQLAEEDGYSSVAPVIKRFVLKGLKADEPNAESKSYTFITRSWRELEAYIKVRNLGSVEGFAPVALDMAMSRNRLSARQKTEFERILGN